MTEPAKLSVSNLQAGYGDVQVLWDISLEVKAGELVCLIGSNGAGKTTLLRCVSGTVPTTAGTILVDGKDMTNAATADLVNAGVAHVPEGRRLFSAMSVRDNLLMGAYLREDKNAVAADLERVYAMFPILLERQRQDAGTLSGGEQQMCAIGRALMARPRLLLLDEPSMGLAPIFVEKIFEIVREINAQGTPVLLVEQNALMALDAASRGYVMETGRITLEGPASELKTNEAVQKAYLGLD